MSIGKDSNFFYCDDDDGESIEVSWDKKAACPIAFDMSRGCCTSYSEISIPEFREMVAFIEKKIEESEG